MEETTYTFMGIYAWLGFNFLVAISILPENI